ncbi:MAG: L28 family ribosomal protein [Patescibacteria group bacterium]
MAKVCSRCHRGPRTGNVRSHSNIATKRRTMLNLQRQIVKGSRVRICTSCIKTLQKAKAPA